MGQPVEVLEGGRSIHFGLISGDPGLHEAVNKQENLQPEASFLVAGDFNVVSLRHVMLP